MTKPIRIGDIAPDFTADSTMGRISFHEYIAGKWAVFFSHPRDFTPVCTTELAQVARMHAEWAKRNVLPIAYSVNGTESHLRWIKDVESFGFCRVNFPIVDGADRAVARLYQMLDSGAQDAQTVRSAFIIDPQRRIRVILSYPASTGRNLDEILRCVDSLQVCDSQGVVTPANWARGSPAIIRPEIPTEEARKAFPDLQEELP